MAPEKREKSCGAVLYADTPEGRRYVLVRGTSGLWTFPGGHMEAGESEEQTALREVREETGAGAVLIGDFRTCEEYALAREGHPEIVKQFVYFLAETVRPSLQPQDTREIKEVRLMDYPAALAALYSEGTRRILTEAERFLAERERKS